MTFIEAPAFSQPPVRTKGYFLCGFLFLIVNTRLLVAEMDELHNPARVHLLKTPLSVRYMSTALDQRAYTTRRGGFVGQFV